MTTEVNSDMNSETNEPIAIIGLAPSYEAFGLILEFLSASSTFGSFDLETISEAIRMQLADEHCLGAIPS